MFVPTLYKLWRSHIHIQKMTKSTKRFVKENVLIDASGKRRNMTTSGIPMLIMKISFHKIQKKMTWSLKISLHSTMNQEPSLCKPEYESVDPTFVTPQ